MPPKQQLNVDVVVWRNICVNRSSIAFFTTNEDDPADLSESHAKRVPGV